VSKRRSAIHVQPGNGAADAVLRSWFERQNAAVLRFADVYRACAFAVRHRSEAPDVTAVGLDGLDADESAIVRYLCEAWPAGLCVAYGEAAGAASFPATANLAVCRTVAELEEVLSEAEADEHPALTRHSAQRAVRHETIGHDQPPGDATGVLTKLAPAAGAGAETAAADTAAASGSMSQEQPAVPREPLSQRGIDAVCDTALLTREELAALLEDMDR
jgi:hypothetical protein